MALETFANAHTAFLEAVELCNDECLTTASAYLTQIEAIKDAKDSETASAFYNALANARAYRANELIAVHAPLIRQALQDICRASGVGIAYQTFWQAWEELNQYNDAVGQYTDSGRDHKYVSRDWTRGAITAPTSTKVWRIVENEFQHELGAGFPQTARLEVINSTTDNALRIGLNNDRATPSGADWFQQIVDSAGAPTPVTLVGYDRYSPVPDIENHTMTPTSTTHDANPGTDGIPGWTTSATVGYRVQTDSTLRGLNSLEINQAVVSTASSYDLYQTIGSGINPDIPYLPVLIVENTGTFSGTLRVQWGSQSKDFTNANMTGAGTIDFLPVDINWKLWPRNWQNSSPQLKLSVITLTSGACKVYGLMLIPGTYHPGTGCFYFSAGGSTKADFGATGSFTDVVGTAEGKVAKVVNLVSFILHQRGTYVVDRGGSTISDP